MGYYDNVLAHSARKGSQRKNHKYTARQWVNGRWKYFYGKAKDNIGGRLTGDYYDKKAEEYENEAERLKQYRYMMQDAGIKSASNNHNIKNDRLRAANEQYLDDVVRKHGEYNDRQIEAESAARKYRKKAENSIGEKVTGKRSKAKMDAAEKRFKETDKLTDYWEYNREKKKHNKSVKGISENVAAKGREALSNLFKSKTTVTVTSNLMPAGTKKVIKKK